MACKKRKVDSECRLFKEEWAWKYFFTEYNGKPICLICNEAVAVLKDFNLARHFNTKHAKTKYASMNDAERKVNAEILKKRVSGERNMFIKQNTAKKASTLAGYIVAYKIAKNNKPYSEGEFVKDCMVSMSNILCPEKSKEFESVSLSRKTVTTRIDAIASNLSTQLRQRIEKFKYFSVTMDESTDRSDTAQLLIFIRGVDDEFNITEELACLQSLKGKTTGQIIYNEFSEGLQNLNAPISKLCNITTDGALNMVGKNAGFSGIFRNQNPNHDVVFLHCIIHQDVLCKAAIDITHVLNVVIKLINTIRSRGLVHRQFQEFLIEVDADYSDLLYHTKVRWLSCGYAFERVWNLKEEIQDFLKNRTEKWSDFQIFEDKDWRTDFAFFTDLLEHYNKLNKKLQGKNQFLDETWGCLKSFKTQLFLFYNCMEKNSLTHFPRLKSMAPVSENKLKEFSQVLKKLHTEFETRFQDFKNIQSSLDVFSMPFNVDPENVSAELQLEIIEMQCSTHLKQLFLNSAKLDFYRTLPKAEYPQMIAHAQKIMAMFGSSYVCEQTFSTMKLRKSSIRNRLTDEHLFSQLKVTSSQLEPAFEDIMANQKQFHMSHTPTMAGPSNKS